MSLNIIVYQAGCGDAIRVTFEDSFGVTFNILIDSGYTYTYYETIKQELQKLPKNQFIDIWILTHLDDDHINGGLAL